MLETTVGALGAGALAGCMQLSLSFSECGGATKCNVCSQKDRQLLACMGCINFSAWGNSLREVNWGVGRTSVIALWDSENASPTQGNFIFIFYFSLYFSLFKYLSYCLLLCGLQLIAAVKRLIATWVWLWRICQPSSPSAARATHYCPGGQPQQSFCGTREVESASNSLRQGRLKPISQKAYLSGDRILEGVVVKSPTMNTKI